MKEIIIIIGLVIVGIIAGGLLFALGYSLSKLWEEVRENR